MCINLIGLVFLGALMTPAHMAQVNMGMGINLHFDGGPD